MRRACAHSKDGRSLLGGYDVVCGDCEQIIGRVALFPCAVLSDGEARALRVLVETLHKGAFMKAERDAIAKLDRAAR